MHCKEYLNCERPRAMRSPMAYPNRSPRTPANGRRGGDSDHANTLREVSRVRSET
jgi:hypothetical protein